MSPAPSELGLLFLPAPQRGNSLLAIALPLAVIALSCYSELVSLMVGAGELSFLVQSQS